MMQAAGPVCSATYSCFHFFAAFPVCFLVSPERGVNCISYFRGGDRPYLASGADDHKVRVWDYQTKACVATLDGHTNNISQTTQQQTAASAR
jgi:coatomer subunit beta'